MIKNFDQLATTSSRKQALLIAEAGLAAVATSSVVRSKIGYDPGHDTLTIGAERFDLKPFKRVVCIGFGKAALSAVTELYSLLDKRINCGFVIDLREGSVGNLTCRIGTHPHPTVVNVEATQELLELLGTCAEEDFVICVVSGGGSSLLCYPHELSCEAETSIIAALTLKGATIQEINTVRKHISKVKGGNLAVACYPATVVALIFSDVPGDDLGMVASGPTVKDTTTSQDAAEVLNHYDVLKMCQLPHCSLFETPKDDKYFARVHNILMVSGKTALEACRRKADELGFKVAVFSDHFTGEAREIGAAVAAAKPVPQTCLIGAGETTVMVGGMGLGGRNQEMALAALPSLTADEVLVCVASDGHDNTDAAGAIVDAGVAKKAAELHLDPKGYLDNNDSYHFFEQTGDLLFTGPTGTNVSDFFVLVKN